MKDRRLFIGTLMKHAYNAFAESSWEAAKTLYQFVAFLAPKYVKPFLFVADLEEKINGEAAAEETYKVLLQTFKDPELSLCAAEFYWRHGQRETALQVLTDAHSYLQSKGTLSSAETQWQEKIITLLGQI
jgi:hypothetical protein